MWRPESCWATWPPLDTTTKVAGRAVRPAFLGKGKRMKLKIEIELDNAAFEDNGPEEVTRILECLASRLPDPPALTGQELSCHDVNGNWVGYARIVKGKISERR